MGQCSRFLPILLLIIPIVGAPAVHAEDYSNIRIVRLSFVEGDVQYQRPGEDWQAAQVNLPIQRGFVLQTGDGYAEVEFEQGLAIRLAVNSSLEFTELALVDGHRVTHVSVGKGTALITANLAHHDELSVTASDLKLNVPRNGRFRVDVSTAENWVSVFHGKIVIESGAGASISLGGGHSLHENSADAGSPQIVRSPSPDAFDKWVSQREQVLAAAQVETSDYLGSQDYTSGFADLYDFGLWSDIPGYGFGWQPYGLGPNWMPYVNGAWAFMPLTGWNWISGEPWGWLPYHFGGWINYPGIGWAWVPRGVTSWRPTTAAWVQVNGQQGWIPVPPPQPTKPPKGQRSPVAPVVILAAQGPGGLIKAGARVPVTQNATARLASAPSPIFAPRNGQSVQGVAHATVPVQAIPFSQGHALSGPEALRAPGFSAAQLHRGQPNSAPPSLQSPRSAPAAVAGFRAASGGSGGSFAGTHTSGGASMPTSSSSPSGANSAAPTSSASAHAGGSGAHR